MPEPIRTPSENVIYAEDEAGWEKLQAEFIAFAGCHGRLKSLFIHLCDGERDPGTLARKLGIPVASVRNLERRLQRQHRAFQTRRTSYN